MATKSENQKACKDSQSLIKKKKQVKFIPNKV